MRRALTAIALAFVPLHPAWGQTLGQAAQTEVGLPPQELVTTLALRPAPVQSDQRPGAVLDWFPGTLFPGVGGFRVTGGVSDTLGHGRDGEPRGRLVPYIGFGWQGALLDGRVLVGLDFGAIYQGNPDVRVNPDSAADQTISHDEAGKISGTSPFQPVISLNLIYRF